MVGVPCYLKICFYTYVNDYMNVSFLHVHIVTCIFIIDIAHVLFDSTHTHAHACTRTHTHTHFIFIFIYKKLFYRGLLNTGFVKSAHKHVHFWGGIIFKYFILNFWNDYAINLYFDTNTFKYYRFQIIPRQVLYTIWPSYLYCVSFL